MLNDPDIVLLDEPTAFLDAHSAEAMRRVLLLDYQREGKTILLVTQKLDEVTRYNAKISIIRKGRVIRGITDRGTLQPGAQEGEGEHKACQAYEGLCGGGRARAFRGRQLGERPHDAEVAHVKSFREMNSDTEVAGMGANTSIASVDYKEHLIGGTFQSLVVFVMDVGERPTRSPPRTFRRCSAARRSPGRCLACPSSSPSRCRS